MFLSYSIGCEKRVGRIRRGAKPIRAVVPPTSPRTTSNATHTVSQFPFQIRIGRLLAGGAGADTLRPVAVGGLHGVPRLAVHRHPHHRRPLLLGQDGGQVQGWSKRRELGLCDPAYRLPHGNGASSRNLGHIFLTMYAQGVAHRRQGHHHDRHRMGHPSAHLLHQGRYSVPS